MKLRGQDQDPLESHSLYFEQHGNGSKQKVIFIMGLNSSCFAWSKQVLYFSGRDVRRLNHCGTRPAKLTCTLLATLEK